MASPAGDILPLAGDIFIDSMTNGFRWNADGPIYYSFSDGLNGELWADPQFIGEQIDFVFSIVESYVAQDFGYLGQFSSPQAAGAAGSNLNVSIDSVVISDKAGDSALALGLFPNQAFAQNFLGELYYPGAEGDIFINTNSSANTYGYEPGDAGFSLLLHEIGHALGLKHPHDAGGTGRPTFSESGIDGLDIDWLTIMSYDDDYNWNLSAWDPATPMILDVIALQYLYGPNLSSNSGDETFVLSSQGNLYLTLFDASGNDTIDLSQYSEGAYVELPRYTVSSEQYAPFGLVTTLDGGAQIQIGGSPQTLYWIMGHIENVIGSSFGDLIDGSPLADNIMAGGGNDDIYVGSGDDTVDGGEGTDWVYFLASFEDSEISFMGDAIIVTSELDGTNTLTNIDVLIFDHAGVQDLRQVSELATLLEPPSVPDVFQWQLIAQDGFAGGIGGFGQVFGTPAFQGISVIDVEGGVSLDPSFNTGGDVVFLNGNASAWQAFTQGSNAILFDGDTIVQIPVGPAGLPLFFDDGIRTLRFDLEEGALLIGSTALGQSPTSIVSLAEDAALPPGYDGEAAASVILNAGGEVFAAGDIEVFGTSVGETVSLVLGNVQFDPSFNLGGDEVRLIGEPETFLASVSGSNVVLGHENYQVSIPVGVNGLDLSFSGAVHSLYFDPGIGAPFIGDQMIGPEAAALTFV